MEKQSLNRYAAHECVQHIFLPRGLLRGLKSCERVFPRKIAAAPGRSFPFHSLLPCNVSTTAAPAAVVVIFAHINSHTWSAPEVAFVRVGSPRENILHICWMKISLIRKKNLRGGIWKHVVIALGLDFWRKIRIFFRFEILIMRAYIAGSNNVNKNQTLYKFFFCILMTTAISTYFAKSRLYLFAVCSPTTNTNNLKICQG